MTPPKLLMTPDVARRIADRLSRLPSVARFGRPGEPQSATLTHALTDLEESFRKYVDVLLPKLLDENTSPDSMNDVLLDIGEELRHVLYHVKDAKYFGYLVDDGT